jgi:hypothetical protein
MGERWRGIFVFLAWRFWKQRGEAETALGKSFHSPIFPKKEVARRQLSVQLFSET